MIRPISIANTKSGPAFKGVTFIRDSATQDLSIAVWYDEDYNDQIEWRDVRNADQSSSFDLGSSNIAEKLGEIVRDKGVSSKNKSSVIEVKRLLDELVDKDIKSSLGNVVRIFLGKEYTTKEIIGKSMPDINKVIIEGKAKYNSEKDGVQSHLLLSI